MKKEKNIRTAAKRKKAGNTFINQNKKITEAAVMKLNLTQEWDKTYPKSDKVNHSKVTFHNRYGITLAAYMYTPKNAQGKLPAVAVS